MPPSPYGLGVLLMCIAVIIFMTSTTFESVNGVIIAVIIFIIGFFVTPAPYKIIDAINDDARKRKIDEKMQEQEAFDNQQIAKGSVRIIDENGNDVWLTKNEANELLLKVVKSIKEFKPSKNYASEEGYHAELYGWLKAYFKNAKTEEQIGSSKPDISISNIAIEVKGPTDDNAVNTLPTKCLKYLKHYNSLIFVLFNPHFSENNFREIAQGIKKFHPGVIIIRKESERNSRHSRQLDELNPPTE